MSSNFGSTWDPFGTHQTRGTRRATAAKHGKVLGDKRTPEEKALQAAQIREIARQDEIINEKKRRIIRAQTSNRASMLSGHMAPESPQGVGTGQGRPGRSGRSGRRVAGGLGGAVAGGGGGRSGGRR